MKAELRSLGFFLAFQDRYEDRNQFVAFRPQWLKLVRVDNAGINQEFEPIAALLDFTKRVPTFSR